MKRIPDFTDARWHLARSDRDLERSVLQGRGSMPAMKAKIGPQSATSIIKLVRRFRGGEFVVSEEGTEEDQPDPPKVAVVPSSPSRPAPAPGRSSRENLVLARKDIDSSKPAWRLFGRFCVACHGNDGRSGPIRADVPLAPDFTSSVWHEGHDTARLRISILEGRGTRMPAFHGRISDAEAVELASALRSLSDAPAPTGPGAYDDFDRRFDALMGKFDELKRSYYALPQPPG
jgi:hypothetical protein